MKYRKLIELLEDDVLYTPATITALAVDAGLFNEMSAQEQRLGKTRVRIALGRFSNYHDFPDEGDGMVTIKGQAPTPGWLGERWKGALAD